MNIKRIATASALALAMATATVVAQGNHQGHQGGDHTGKRVERMAAALDLTEAQKAAATALFTESRTASKPLIAELKENRKSLAEAAKAGKTEAEIDALSARRGAILGELSAVHSKAMAKFYAQLTPEQRQKAETLKRGFFEGRRGKSRNADGANQRG